MFRCSRVLGLAALALLFLSHPSFAAGAAELLADVNTNLPSGSSADWVTRPLIPLSNRVLFVGYEPSTGAELWASDGTPRGTRLLRDLWPGTDSPEINPVGMVRQAALLQASFGGLVPAELWRSDGTAAGTYRLSKTAQGTLVPCFTNGFSFLAASAGNVTFVLATDLAAPSGCGLWKTDGTVAGTVRVKQLAASFVPVGELVANGSRVYFVLDGSLWTSNGTAAGTVALRRFSTDLGTGGPRRLTPFGTRLAFFAQSSNGGGEELWWSDGTPAGTKTVTQFQAPSPFGFEERLQVIGDAVYFLADDGTGVDLWRVEASGAALRRVTDFVADQPLIAPLVLVRAGGRLLFAAREEGEVSPGLWTSGGTPATTSRLGNCPDGCPDLGSTPLVPLGDRVLFVGSDLVHGPALWVTDGTGAGTRRLYDGLCTGSCSSQDPVLAPFFGKVFFLGEGSQGGAALWRTDGTAAGTVRVADLGPDRALAGNLFLPVQVGRRFFFAADPGRRGAQLWVSDGSSTGTGLVTIVDAAAAAGSDPVRMTPLGNGVVFGAYDGTANRLWTSDGTPAGTAAIPGALLPYRTFAAGNGLVYFLQGSSNRQLWRSDGTGPGTFRVSPDGIGGIADGTVVGNRLLFLVIDPQDQQHKTLWQSDGTLAGTHALFDLPRNADLARFFRGLGGRLYFVANPGVSTADDQLWVTDGTAAGTVILTNFHNYAFDARYAPEMALVGSTVFFSPQGALWKTDGTVAGTVRVPFVGFGASDFLEFQGKLFFLATTDDQTTLWRSDGTAAGTTVVKKLGPATQEKKSWLTKAGNRLFFAADDGEHGRELWISDGTEDGTEMVSDIASGDSSSFPSWLVASGNRVYFSATDGLSGFELWESDGTDRGTRLVHDVAPGPLSSFPEELAVSGGRLYFAADDGIHGEEPWALPLEGRGGCVATAEALCLGGRFRVEAHWRDFAGHRGTGHAVALTGDTGYFWFFDAANVEVVLKVLDGRGVNDHFWVFYGALSNVEYSLTVTDTQTGAVRRYVNPPGRLASVSDVEAFGPRGAHRPGVVTLGPAPARSEAPKALQTAQELSVCEPSANRLCLGNGRFAAEIVWKNPDGRPAPAMAVPLPGGDTGYFWFLGPGNVEVMLKVLDGRGINGHHWVFYGALSDLEYQVIVTDTLTGIVRIYNNPRGRLASVADTAAF